MSTDILGTFVNRAEKDRGVNVNTFDVDVNDLPTQPDSQRTLLNTSEGSFESVDVETQATKQELDSLALVNSTGFVTGDNDGGDVLPVELDFRSLDFRLPYACSSYDELATIAVGNIFSAEGINNINCSFFGSLLENSAPKHCSKVTIGSHTFVVRDDSEDRLMYIFDFLKEARRDLDLSKRYECPLVRVVDINHSLAYSLILTPKDLRDIKKSFPTYKISFVPTHNIADIKLIIELSR